MKPVTILWLAVFFVGIVFGIIFWQRAGQEKAMTQAPSIEATPLNKTSAMQLSSSAFEHNGTIPRQYTCDEANSSPPLTIAGVPSEAQSLVLIMDDPDAPVGIWDHWVIFNISPGTTEIPEGREPEGIHGKGTAGNTKYTGPCPPDREHRYFFKLYALNTQLDLTEGVSKAEVEQAMAGHVIDHTELVGRYDRS